MLFGRGACDAKGILAAQVAAAEWLRRPARRGSRCSSSSAKSGEATAPSVANEQRAGRRSISHQRRADRQPAGRRHPRHPARAASRRRARRAFIVSRARRIRDRQAARCADGAARGCAAGRSAARTDALHRRADRRRRGAERGLAARVRGAHVQNGRDGDAVREALHVVESLVSLEHVLDVPAVRMQTRAGIRHRCVSVHHRRAAADALGNTAADRARLHPRRAHRRRASRHRRDDGGHPTLRIARKTAVVGDRKRA